MKIRLLVLLAFAVLSSACTAPFLEESLITAGAAETSIAALQSQLNFVSTQIAENAAQVEAQSTLISYLATRGPASLPPTISISPHANLFAWPVLANSRHQRHPSVMSGLHPKADIPSFDVRNGG